MQNETTTTFKTCPRCKGEGVIKHFSHVLGGLCFKCKGGGEVAVKVKLTPREIAEAEYWASQEASDWNYNDNPPDGLGFTNDAGAQADADLYDYQFNLNYYAY